MFISALWAKRDRQCLVKNVTLPRRHLVFALSLWEVISKPFRVSWGTGVPFYAWGLWAMPDTLTT